MTQMDFNITNSKKGLVGFVVLFLLIQTGLFVLLFDADLRLFVIVLSIVFFATCITAILAPLLFKVEVRDSNISVRTHLGKSFRINSSEITEIVFRANYYKSRQIVMLTICTVRGKFRINQDMNGFQQMAEYILEKLENGEIRRTAVTADCKRNLSNFVTRD